MRECVWEGPPVLTVKRQISTQYESNENAKHFFVNILKIPNATYKDIIEQLRALRSTEESVKKLELAGELYVELQAMARAADLRELRRVL